MIVECCVYRCLWGRLPALLNRFETATLKLFEKHAIRPAGFFTTMAGESHLELTYFLIWETLAEKERKWLAFLNDPDWKAALAKSVEDGQIVLTASSQLFAPTAFVTNILGVPSRREPANSIADDRESRDGSLTIRSNRI